MGGVPALRLAEQSRRHPTLTQTNKLRGRTTPPPTHCPRSLLTFGLVGVRNREIWDGATRQGKPQKPGPRSSGRTHTPLYTPSPY